ncbi:IclR family transcriptional regulator [Polaromonas sp. P2-4]|nr:IclR family transcriptional regulator [Polaromonas sp. P2-4]
MYQLTTTIKLSDVAYSGVDGLKRENSCRSINECDLSCCMRKQSEATGVQSAAKALSLLRHVGLHHAQGVRLTDLIGLTGFDKSTVHRLLACLTEEGFVERIARTKRYRLGVEVMQLGLVSADMAPLVDRFRPAMQRIARMSGDTVFLVVRSGDYALCIHREEGPYPVKAFVVEPGKRRPLGISAVGVGMLAQESDAEVVAIHARNARIYERLGMSLAVLHRLAEATRQAGFTEMTDFGPEGTAGVGYAFQISATTRVGVSIAAISSRMNAQRRRELGALLQQELAPMVWEDRKGLTSSSLM